MDEDLKRKFDKFCNEVCEHDNGILHFCKDSSQTAKNTFWDINRQGSFFSPENTERLKKSIAKMEETGGTIHEVKYDD